MSDYWIYEDMTVHTATVHRADCRYCNHGAGMGRGRIAQDSRWLGPYNSMRAAQQAPVRANSMLRNCGICMK
jgi:F-type H+-transporting ATPase subunit beta